MNNPNGTVTFLFTDIESSARLAQIHQNKLKEILDIHHSIIKNTVESYNGFVFKTAGDAFCCAFQNPDDAIRASVDSQRKLNSEDWKDTEIKVKMGIHTGNAEWNGTDYMGYITLARTSRVMSVAYGGQILNSNDTYESSGLLHSNEITFRDLGERRLKDLSLPLKLYQIISTGIPAEFPTLKTLDARPNNLPIQLSNFIGREKEITEINRFLLKSRLVTLLGPGGTGKTRLAIQIGADLIDEFANGVFIIELAAITDPTMILQTLMNSIGMKEVKSQTPESTLTEFLKDKEMMFIMDNCEHLLKECSELTEMLLRKCGKLKIIATSREVLNCQGEISCRIPPLSLPDPKIKESIEKFTKYEAVRLFIERAIVINQDFRITEENAPAVSNICLKLDGIPLAIELAAARIKILTPDGINERLNDRFKLLTGGKRTALPRQQTLKALIDWSYDLLSEQEKLLLQRLTVFSGGWRLDVSEKICSDEIISEYDILDLLGKLADKSLIKVNESFDSNCYNLLETIKKYGDDKLTESGKKNEFQKKHFDYFYELAENSLEKLTGDQQKIWIKKLDSDIGNLREALNWALINEPLLSLQMSVNLGKFWEYGGYYAEGLEYLRKSSEISPSADMIWKARSIYLKGLFNIHQGNYSNAKKFLKESQELFNEIDYKDGEALAYTALATIALFEADYDTLNKCSEKSLDLSYEINNKSYIARNIQNIAMGLMQQGYHEESRNKFEESLAIFREVNDPVQLARTIGNIGALEYLLGNYEKAGKVFEESLVIRMEIGERQGISIALNNLGSVNYMQKKYKEAEQYLEKSLAITKELGDKRIIVTSVATLGSIANDTGDFSKAKKFYTESIIVSNEIGDNYSIAKGVEGIASIFQKINKIEECCLISGKYISMLTTSNKNMIEAELVKIEEMKTFLRSNLSESDFNKFFEEGEKMSIEKVLEYAELCETFVNQLKS